MTAIVAILALTAPADAGWFGGRGFGGKGFAGAGGFVGQRGGDRGIRMMRPGYAGSARGIGHRTETTDRGRFRFGGGTMARDGRQISNGGRRTAGDDPPRHPRRPRFPVIVAAPPIVATIPAGRGEDDTPSVSRRAGRGGRAQEVATSSQAAINRTTRRQSVALRRNTGVPPAGERRYVPDEVLIQLPASVTTEAVDALARRMRLDRLESFEADGITMFRWRISDRRPVPVVIRSLEAERMVVAAQPNYLYSLQEQRPSNDRPQALAPIREGEPDQYALAKLRLPQAHELATGDKVLVAVIDSGIDATHPELAGLVADSYDALASDEKAHPHGTGVAGAIVAHARLMGAAPKARILAIRAFGLKNSTAEATTYGINKGVVWALSHGARIIKMSFTGPRDPSVEQRLKQAQQHGVVLIAAAGNAGPKSAPLYPAAYPDVIAVTATDADDALFAGANRGRHIAVAAPGVDLLLPAPETSYQITTGTSFAAAEVSGVVALLLERRPDLGPDRVRQILTATARDLGPKGFDPDFGAGLVDAYAAMRALEPAIATTGAAEHPAASR